MTTAHASTDFSALGFDPAPGQLGAVEGLAQKYRGVSESLNEAYEALTRIGKSGGIWQGEAAQAFQGTVGELPKYLDMAFRSLGDAASALEGWQEDLASMQQAARDLEQQAKEALAKAQQARQNPDLNLAGQHFPDEQSLQNAQRRLDAAVAAVRAADAELEAIREQARRLQEQHTQIAEEVARALQRARDIAPEEPGFFERLGEAIGRALDGAVEAIADTLQQIGEAAWQLIKDNANLISMISDVLADLSTIIGVAGDIIGLIPTPITAGLDTALGAISLGLQGAALGGHLLAKAAGADVDPFVIAMDTYGLVSGVVGLIPGPIGSVGLVMDAAGLGFQAGVEIASDGEVPTFWGDLKDYWVPRNLTQAGVYAAGTVIPGLSLAVPFWNAIQDGHKADVEARNGG